VAESSASVSQDEGPIELIFRKLTRVEVGSRNGPDVDAVNLDSSNRMSRPSALATTRIERRRAAVNALCGRVEVVGDMVYPTESGHDGQATDERELGQ